jgi:hypothetical protein
MPRCTCRAHKLCCQKDYAFPHKHLHPASCCFTHARMHACMHARARTHTHTHTHTQPLTCPSAGSGLPLIAASSPAAAPPPRPHWRCPHTSAPTPRWWCRRPAVRSGVRGGVRVEVSSSTAAFTACGCWVVGASLRIFKTSSKKLHCTFTASHAHPAQRWTLCAPAPHTTAAPAPHSPATPAPHTPTAPAPHTPAAPAPHTPAAPAPRSRPC